MIDEVDKLCRQETVYMIGPEKGKRLAQLIREKKREPLMKRRTLLILAYMSLGIWMPILAAEESRAEESGTLILEDDFDRDEATPDKEDIGNGWTSNSAWRAKGHPSA